MPIYKTTRMLFSFTLVLVASLITCLLLQSPYSQVKKTDYTFTILIKQPTIQSIQKQNRSISTGKIVYGRSGLLGKRLICIKISPAARVKTKILMTYEIHGYEDLFLKDGQELVDIGNAVAKYFESNRNMLGNSELYIVPSLNPDGLSRGISNNGIGRCQVSLGIDMNRDFDYKFITYKESRNHTLSKPFSAPESKALKNLVNVIKPNVVIDCHGWGNKFIGDEWLANCFKSSLGIYAHYNFADTEHGFFSAWAGTQGAKSMLLEYPKSAYIDSAFYANRTVSGIENLVAALE